MISNKSRRDAITALLEAIDRVDRLQPQGELYNRALMIRASLEVSGFTIRRLPTRKTKGDT